MGPSGDRGDIVLGWITRVTSVLAVIGVLGFDGVSLVGNRFAAEDHARTAAREAVTAFERTRTPQAAYDAALGAVLASGDTIDAPGFTAAPDGSVTLTLRRTAPTLVLEKIPPLRSWTAISVTVTGRPAA